MLSFLIKSASAFLIRHGAKRALMIKRLDLILADFSKVYGADSMVESDLERYQMSFRFYSDRIDIMFPEALTDDERGRIVHGLNAARVMCWLLRFKQATDAEIIDLMQARLERIREGAYPSSYEDAMQRLCRAGWPQDQTPDPNHVQKVKEWCRANMDRLHDIQIAWENDLPNYALLKDAV